MTVDRATVEKTYETIRPHLRLTPVVEITGADLGLAAFPLTLKLESLQHSGSFKARGAFANLLLRRLPAAGVVAASGGNHGAAVAYAAMRLGVPARIFVPTVSSPAKIAPAIRGAPRLRRGAPSGGGFGGHVGAPITKRSRRSCCRR